MIAEQTQEVSQPTQPIQPEPVEPKKKLNPLIIVILLIVILLITLGTIYAVKYFNKPQACTLGAKICPDGLSVGRTGPNCEFAPCPTTIDTSVVDETVDWKTYTNIEYGFEFKYPSAFIIKEDQNLFEVSSLACSCETDAYGSNDKKISASQVKVSISFHEGKSFKDIWKKVFGFDFSEKNYDGTSFIGGKKAYYFFQGAESAFGRQAYLVETSPTTALEINVYTPVLIYRCDECFEKNNVSKVTNDQILSTFKFINQKETKFTCPENGWVDCMPILTEEGKSACSKEAENWYKTNCPDFKGLAQ